MGWTGGCCLGTPCVEPLNLRRSLRHTNQFGVTSKNIVFCHKIALHCGWPSSWQRGDFFLWEGFKFQGRSWLNVVCRWQGPNFRNTVCQNRNCSVKRSGIGVAGAIYLVNLLSHFTGCRFQRIMGGAEWGCLETPCYVRWNQIIDEKEDNLNLDKRRQVIYFILI